MLIRTTLAAVAAALVSLSAHAAPPAAAASAATPGIDKRQAQQERRIDQGVASGELTRREARRLNREQNVIDKAENRAKADGTVTAKERKRLHHLQDGANADIARQKHDRQDRPRADKPAGG
jgi:polyhydroxyalkanoate synthesis regulator phasin